MFIREKKQANKIYLYLEHRYSEDGKIKSKSTYLGQREQAKGKLADLMLAGQITQEQFAKFAADLPEPTPKPKKEKTIVVKDSEYVTNQELRKRIDGQSQEIRMLKNRIEELEEEKKQVCRKATEEARKERIKFKEKIRILEQTIDNLQAKNGRLQSKK